MKKRASIVDVAREAGVGIGTVSRVLNNAANVHPETAAQVHSAVAKLGYRLPARANRPGPRANKQPKQPREGSEIMMIIMGRQGLDWVLHHAPVYAGVIHGIEAAVTDHNYRMVMRHASDWPHLAQILKSTPPAGVIILGFEPDPASHRELSTQILQIPAVWTMGSPLQFHGDRVYPDHLRIGTLAAEYLLKRGHRRCAALASATGTPANLMTFRNDSFRWAIENAGGSVLTLLDPQLVLRNVGQHEVSGAILDALIHQLLNTKSRPTALFLEGDILAPCVYSRLAAAGLRPQKDIEIVTCNNERPYLGSLDPKPTAIDVQPQIIGRRTVDLLLWRIANLHAPLLHLMVEPVLVAHPTDAD